MTRVRREAVLCLALCAAAILPAVAVAGDDAQPVEHLLQFRGAVVVGADGNGVLAASFPTTVEGENVHYVLQVETGCPADGGNPCPAAVGSIRVTLNDEVVLSDGNPPSVTRVPVALNAVNGASNRIVAAAGGAPASAARVTVQAIRPLPVVVGGRSVLPVATRLDNVQDLLIIHNAGPADMAFRLEAFNADGSPAAVTPPRALAANATITVDIGETVAALNPAWQRGAVHVRWAARGFARLSTVAREFRRAPDMQRGAGAAGAELALDDYGPFMLNAAEAATLGF
jgi:hypothetical protein